MAQDSTNNKIFPSVLKGAVLSLICTLIGILIFAFIIKISSLNETAIKTVNQFIKVVSVFIGCFFSLKENKGLIKGILLGIIYTILTYLIFSMLSGTLNFGTAFIIDIAFGLVVGAISGILTIGAKNR